MPSVKTQVNCPNCKFPVVADIQQLIDVGVEPGIKELFLGGMLNVVQCPSCQQASMLSTPLVYHDPAKELLLTYFPPEMNLSMPEQEKEIGRLLKQAIDSLKPEDRKGYLFSPKQAFTLQGMLEMILEADGITKEMLQEQQEKVTLLEDMLKMEKDALDEFIPGNDQKFDQAFFSIISQMAAAMEGAGQAAEIDKLVTIQKKLLDLSSFGKELKRQSEELEEALAELKDLGQDLTREKMLELVLNAPTQTKVHAYVSLARQVMDYEFFAALSAKIDAAEGDEKDRLQNLRDNILKMTEEIDQQIQARIEVANKNLDALLGVEDIPGILQANLGAIDDFFLQALSARMAKSEGDKDSATMAKLQLILDTLQKLSQPSHSVEFLTELIEAPDDDARLKLLDEKAELIDEEFLKMATNMMMQTQNDPSVDAELAEKVQFIYRKAVSKSMSANLKKD